MVEGAPLLREYTGLNLYRGFESLSLRHNKTFQLVQPVCKASGAPQQAGLFFGLPAVPGGLLSSVPERLLTGSRPRRPAQPACLERFRRQRMTDVITL